MTRYIVTAAALLALVPSAVFAYDPAADRAATRVLAERIDGDVAQGLVPAARAALLRAEVAAVQRAIANNDSAATEMLAEIDRDLAAVDLNVDANEANRDLLYHAGDKITLAMRDGRAWQIDGITNRDVLDRLASGVMYVQGVQGVLLAKSDGFSAVTLLDPASGMRLRFRFTIVSRTPA
ncbi:MAG: hypothetical protein NVSMB64_17730 [Candidatus Velthaea sp.]